MDVGRLRGSEHGVNRRVTKLLQRVAGPQGNSTADQFEQLDSERNPVSCPFSASYRFWSAADSGSKEPRLSLNALTRTLRLYARSERASTSGTVTSVPGFGRQVV